MPNNTQLNLHRIIEAKALILAAEEALWPLSAGERRDLLKDNTDWPPAFVDHIVHEIGAPAQ